MRERTNKVIETFAHPARHKPCLVCISKMPHEQEVHVSPNIQ